MARGVERAGEVLKRKALRPPHPRETNADTRQAIAAHLAELRQEFGDQATASASERRALNLYRRADIDLATFIGRLYQARSLTREQCNSRGRGTGPRRPMAYFFAVLEQVLNPEAAPEKAG